MEDAQQQQQQKKNMIGKWWDSVKLFLFYPLSLGCSKAQLFWKTISCYLTPFFLWKVKMMFVQTPHCPCTASWRLAVKLITKSDIPRIFPSAFLTSSEVVFLFIAFDQSNAKVYYLYVTDAVPHLITFLSICTCSDSLLLLMLFMRRRRFFLPILRIYCRMTWG